MVQKLFILKLKPDLYSKPEKLSEHKARVLFFYSIEIKLKVMQ